MDAKVRRAELKSFLQARRASLAPEAVGLPRGKRRLTPGLRREEVAALSGVGVTWYTWLEQGRAINISGDVLARVSRALKLSASDEAYLFCLAGLPARPVPGTAISAALRAAVDSFTAGPAFIFGPRLDALGHNELAEQVYGVIAGAGRFGSNHLWRCFIDPDRSKLYGVDGLEPAARHLVGLFRSRYADHVGEAEYEDLVSALDAGSPLFKRLWKERHTQPLHTLDLPLEHPSLGRLRFYSVRAIPADGSGNSVNRLFLLPPADDATARAMRRARELVENDKPDARPSSLRPPRKRR